MWNHFVTSGIAKSSLIMIWFKSINFKAPNIAWSVDLTFRHIIFIQYN